MSTKGRLLAEKKLDDFRLLDDDFMTRALDGRKDKVQYILQTILNKPDLEVIETKGQYTIANLVFRSIRLDVYAKDATGKIYDIEIQRADKSAGQKRARYNLSLLDGENLPKSNDHSQLPETYVIFLTENDVLGAGLPIYHIERVIRETDQLFDDEEHIIYVNGAFDNVETELGRLVHDFRCSNSDDMLTPLKDVVSYYKNTEEGRNQMCRAIEEMRNEARILGAIESDLRHGMSEDEVKKDILAAYSFLSEENVDKYISAAKEEMLEMA